MLVVLSIRLWTYAANDAAACLPADACGYRSITDATDDHGRWPIYRSVKQRTVYTASDCQREDRRCANRETRRLVRSTDPSRRAETLGRERAPARTRAGIAQPVAARALCGAVKPDGTYCVTPERACRRHLPNSLRDEIARANRIAGIV